MLNQVSVANLSQLQLHFIVFILKRSVAFVHRLRVVPCGFDDVLRFTMPLTSILVLLIVLTLAGSPARGSTPQQLRQGDQASVKPGPPMSGSDIFKWYCAACHGKNAKGNGPVASELKVPPPDLTALAKRNKGKFPADYVTRVLMVGPKSAHGSPDMPVWGPLFSELNAKGRVTVEIETVVHYLETLQEK